MARVIVQNGLLITIEGLAGMQAPFRVNALALCITRGEVSIVNKLKAKIMLENSGHINAYPKEAISLSA